MKVLLYPHGGSGNHGCEAIVRASAKLTGAEMTLASEKPGQDTRYGLESCCRIIRSRQKVKKVSWSFHAAAVRRFLGDKNALDRLVFSPVFEAARKCDLALSIGGDNYCYGEPVFLYLINRELRKLGTDTVLWGCSLEPELLNGHMMEDIKGYDRIIARESLTYDALHANGIDKAELFPDPAFALERKETKLPDGFMEGNTVGVNLSPMVIGHEKSKGLLFDNIVTLINTILNQTDMSIALIPHVVWKSNDDRQPLGALNEMFKHSGRVMMIEDRPAEELKDIIARCRFVVASRTHACIAAYSSCVPTLALGYSSKAAGIARDVMPAGHKYLVPIQALSGKKDISGCFFDLVSKEKLVKQHLCSFIPDYTGRLSGLHL